MKRVTLPVDEVLPELLERLRAAGSVVLEAPPGAGKTTRVPPALLEVVRGEVVVLEPRRIAARMSARRVAEERGEEVGGVVGYQVRFEEKVSARTRLRFVTEGILTRRMLRDPMLKGVDAVVLDEFHERHMDGDLALALLKRLQKKRPELKLVVMSATLDAAPIAAFLGGCPVVRSEGRRFPLTVRHEAYTAEGLPVQVRKALSGLLAEGQAGNVLVFVPGVAEIRRVMRECAEVARGAGMVVLPLYGGLTAAEQDLAVRPDGRRKLIVATNVAESSVTVEGVTAVIDSGLARFVAHSVWTGMGTLKVGRISKASATQRAGRAGRTAPGVVVRLYPEEDFALRREQDLPEIERSDVAGLVLGLRAMGMEVGELEWLSAPPVEAVTAAEELLDRLGARGEIAVELARYPLPPRLARVVVEAVRRGVGSDGCRTAALLGADSRRSGGSAAKADLLEAMDAAFRGAVEENLRRSVEQLLRVAEVPKAGKHDDEALLMSVLAGFPDHVARRRAGNLIALATGVSAELADGLGRSEFLVALDAEDRDDQAMPLVRLTARVEPEWLLEMYPERVEETVAVVWNRGAERVEQVTSLLYERLVLEERRGPAAVEAAALLLAEKALEAGVELFVDRGALEGLLARLSFAGVAAPEVESAFREMCAGMSSFAELRAAGPSLLPMLEARAGRLEELAPSSLKLRGGRMVKVHYELGKPPWVSSRLQDFFGMRETPRVGRVSVVVHLLAPNGRAVQVTSDLAGFWERLYPEVRRELMRRYPRHTWPEDPVG